MTNPDKITYLRAGRKLRATGSLVEKDRGLLKVKPDREDWGHVWLTQEEITAGGAKGPSIARKKSEPRKSCDRRPKPIPPPRWKVLVGKIREIQDDYPALPHPPVSQQLLSEIADELESVQTLFRP